MPVDHTPVQRKLLAMRQAVVERRGGEWERRAGPGDLSQDRGHGYGLPLSTTHHVAQERASMQNVSRGTNPTPGIALIEAQGRNPDDVGRDIQDAREAARTAPPMIWTPSTLAGPISRAR